MCQSNDKGKCCTCKIRINVSNLWNNDAVLRFQEYLCIVGRKSDAYTFKKNER